MLSDGNARLVAARRLTGRRGRQDAGRFLAEGAQAVREAIASGRALEVFSTTSARERHASVLAAHAGPIDLVSDKAAAGLSETVTPQGLVAVCSLPQTTLEDALRAQPILTVVLVQAGDPGNAGSIIRTADAAGAGLVVFAGDAVDPYSGKCVRATTGSIFHLDLVTGIDPVAAVRTCRAAGLLSVATTGAATEDLDSIAESGRLLRPSAWIFGNEAHGLSADVVAAADLAIRVPIYGQAESLNVAAAAAVCLFTAARAQRAEGA